MLAICASCGSGGGGGGAGDGEVAPDPNAPVSVALTWSGSDDAAGYVVHWGTTSGVYSHDVDVRKPVADAHGDVTVVIMLDGVDASVARVFFAITSYDAARNASAYSNELGIDAAALSVDALPRG